MAETDLNVITALLPNLTEDEGWKVLFAMADRFDWAHCVWSMGDVEVADEGQTYGETDVPLHPMERAVVASTWEWRKGIADAASSRVGESGLVPTVERHYDGEMEQVGFTVHAIDGETRYDMDGNVVRG